MRIENIWIPRLLLVLVKMSDASYFLKNQFASPPKMECRPDGIRLHLNPLDTFGGHIYVRGFFTQNICHLNYCNHLTRSPILMDLPFRGSCNVRRRRNISPPSISYDVTIIVQHHPLFVTSFDKAYRLNCVYRQISTDVQQKLNVSDLPTIPVQKSADPKCHYDVLAGSINGPIVKFANVGDVVVHRWSCDSDKYGFVVHSCAVRDDGGRDYRFIDERGCVTDSNLFPEITYSTDLRTAFTTVRAFRYADQIMVHFSCQITVCRKSEQGCEGIAPPICRQMDPMPIPVQYVKNKNKGVDSSSSSSNVLPTRETTTTSSTTTTAQNIEKLSSKFDGNYNYPNDDVKLYNYEDHEHSFGVKTSTIPQREEEGEEGVEEWGLEISRKTENESDESPKNRNIFGVEEISKTMENDQIEPMPFPTKSEVYQHRYPRSHRKDMEKLTVEVESTQLLILEPSDQFDPHTSSNQPESSLETSEAMVLHDKSTRFSSELMILTTLSVLQVISIMALIIQRFYYKRSIKKLSNFDEATTTNRIF